MEIQVQTDHHVRGEEELISFITTEVVSGLGPYASRVLSAQVHVSSESGAHKGPPTLRCLLEVRPTGHAPLAVTHRGPTKDVAIHGAVADMRGVLERMFRRINDSRHEGADTIRRSAG